MVLHSMNTEFTAEEHPPVAADETAEVLLDDTATESTPSAPADNDAATGGGPDDRSHGDDRTRFDDLPSAVAVLPLRGTVVCPQAVGPLLVGKARS